MALAAAKPITFIMTRDREQSSNFYRDILGLASAASDPFAAVFELAGATLRITESQEWRPGPYPALGWMVPDIAATIAALTSRGVVMTMYEGFGQDAQGIWTSPDGSAKVAWFTDPDGNVLSLTQC
jgi:catechol 2,3-dioxygenase-like lactoylglutathione lyase family enzyme